MGKDEGMYGGRPWYEVPLEEAVRIWEKTDPDWSEIADLIAKGVPLSDQLAKISDAEIRARRDRLALKDSGATWQFWDEQLRYREAKRLDDQMLGYTQQVTRLTRTIHALTWWIAGLTLIAAAATVAAAVKTIWF